ncbi:MAG: hypothetical protein IT517_04700 [Burkholderiales bacterium]|nr:hypothetical protein [Burkholderiales bacterium]
MADSGRARLLDPVDRISEVLFGLIMAVTIVGSMSIATAGQAEVRTVMLGALGCNIAWGLVDAIMYVVRTVTGRARNRALAQRIAGADAATARTLLADAMPPGLAALVGTDEIDGMRRRLGAMDLAGRPLLTPRDFLEAFAVFALVVLATFPVVVPFLLTDDLATAMRMSRSVTLVMLFVAGHALGRHAMHPRPVLTGLAAAAFGAVLIVVVMALGG